MNKYTKNKSLSIIFSVAVLAVPFFVMAAPGEGDNGEKRSFKERFEIRKIEAEKKLKENKEKKEKKENKKEERQAFACENITQKLENKQKHFSEQKEELGTKKAERTEERQAKRAEHDKMLLEKRASSKERREQMYQNLLNKAETPEQKEAVTAFQNAVEAAITARHKAIDEALKTFRSNADALRASKKDNRAEALASFQSAVSSALAKAKEDCANGVSSEEVRKTYKESIEKAREALKEARTDQGLGEEMKKLAETKNLSIRKALVDYRNAIEAARVALQAALGSQ